MEYTKSDIATILKEKKRTIQYWTDIGLVVPDISPSQGKGNTRKYSDTNLVQFAMIDYLSRLEVDVASIKGAMDGLRKGYDEFKDDNGEVQKILFSDFFKSKEWGDIKELAFVQTWYAVSSLGPRAQALLAGQKVRTVSGFRVFNPDSKEVEGLFSSYRSKGEIVQRFLWLGEIKRLAVIDLLGMESLLSI